jgi:hypothetical protein
VRRSAPTGGNDSKINQKKQEYNRQNGPATAVPFLTADGQRKHVAIDFCFIRLNVCKYIYICISQYLSIDARASGVQFEMLARFVLEEKIYQSSLEN